MITIANKLKNFQRISETKFLYSEIFLRVYASASTALMYRDQNFFMKYKIAVPF